MREETPDIDTESVLDDLSNAAAVDAQSESSTSSFGASADRSADIEHELDDLLATVRHALPTDDVQFDEALVKENLEELLLVLIAVRGEAHGKELLSDLASLFDTRLSPGTVYPTLHSLEEDDVLSMHATVRTKEYSVADEEYVRTAVERTMVQQLAFGLLLSAFLHRL